MEIALLIDRDLKVAGTAGITATPTLVIRDNETSRTIKLEGPADGVTLLPALDRLAQQVSEK